MSKLRAIAAIAALLVSGAASAEVIFNADTGVGFVGKGDVQLAFDWNNAQLQSSAAGVTFSYQVTDTYSAVCTWTTGEGKKGEKTHNVTHKQALEVSSTVASSLRKNKQGHVTGFNLTGFGDSYTESGTLPVVGGPCMGNPGHGGLWTSVERLGNGVGGLYVNYGAQQVLLTP